MNPASVGCHGDGVKEGGNKQCEELHLVAKLPMVHNSAQPSHRTCAISLLALEMFCLLQWLKKCPHVLQILKDSVIARHILSIRPNTWWLT